MSADQTLHGRNTPWLIPQAHPTVSNSHVRQHFPPPNLFPCNCHSNHHHQGPQHTGDSCTAAVVSCVYTTPCFQWFYSFTTLLPLLFSLSFPTASHSLLFTLFKISTFSVYHARVTFFLNEKSALYMPQNTEYLILGTSGNYCVKWGHFCCWSYASNLRSSKTSP